MRKNDTLKNYTLKVYPQGMGRSVYRTIKINGDESLDQLCMVILDAFDFMHEHLYEFCMDNRMYSGNSYRYNPAYGQMTTGISIDSLYLEKGQKFSLHYDFGDDWMFTIHVQSIEESDAKTEPEVLKSKGEIQQYPDWDDEDEDYDDE